jgi:hypothetical protein
MSVVALLATLVLGLLVASTKSNFDTRNTEIEQFSANLTLLDRELVHLGQDAKDARTLLRTFTALKIAQTWTDRGADVDKDAAESVRLLDEIGTRIRGFAPQGDAQNEARKDALDLVRDLKRTSRLLAVQRSDQTPRPFLIIVVFWVSVLLFSFAIFAPRNGTVVAAIIVVAFSVSVAVNVIFDVDRPFAGFVRVSPVPMQQALDRMTP